MHRETIHFLLLFICLSLFLNFVILLPPFFLCIAACGNLFSGYTDYYKHIFGICQLVFLKGGRSQKLHTLLLHIKVDTTALSKNCSGEHHIHGNKTQHAQCGEHCADKQKTQGQTMPFFLFSAPVFAIIPITLKFSGALLLV